MLCATCGDAVVAHRGTICTDCTLADLQLAKRIIAYCCSLQGIDEQLLYPRGTQTRSRTWKVSRIRQQLVWILRQSTRLTARDIANLFESHGSWVFGTVREVGNDASKLEEARGMMAQFNATEPNGSSS